MYKKIQNDNDFIVLTEIIFKASVVTMISTINLELVPVSSDSLRHHELFLQ